MEKWKELETEGINVYPVYFGRRNEDGGWIRWSTHSVVRRSSPEGTSDRDVEEAAT